MAPEIASDGIRALAQNLETLNSSEGRVAAWEEYLANHAEDFAEDAHTATQLIADDDMDGLATHASRFAAERAAAAVARLRDGEA